jgi:hypothetical protein
MVRWSNVATVAVLCLLLTGCLARPPAAAPPAPATFVAPVLDVPAFMARYQAFATAFPDRAGNVPTHVAARDAIAATLRSAGLEVWRQDFTGSGDLTGGLPEQNVIGILWGEHRDEWVVVGAHYDTYSNDCTVASRVQQPQACPGRRVTQGAYDNGSGTALVLETARLLANRTPTYTLAFALLDGEERGLEGAQALVKAATEGTPWGPVTLRAAVTSDMFGLTWPGVQAPVHFYGNSAAQTTLVRTAAKEMGIPDKMMDYAGLPGGGDDAVFAGQGIPTGAFDSDFSSMGAPSNLPNLTVLQGRLVGVYPFWHQADTWDSMTLMAGSPQALAAGFGTALGMEWRVAWGLAQGAPV